MFASSAQAGQASLVDAESQKYPDLLSLRGVPTAAEDWSFAPFADLGAWIGFAAPPGGRTDLGGGFTGPFLMPEGNWLSPQLCRIELSNTEGDDIFDFSRAETFESQVLPGSLLNQTRWPELELQQKLWFSSSRIAVLETSLNNSGDKPLELKAAWTGQAFSHSTLVARDKGLVAQSSSGHQVRLDTKTNNGALQILPATEDTLLGQGYRWELADSILLQPDQSQSLFLFYSWALPGEDLPRPSAASLVEAAWSWPANVQRWNHYLRSIDTGGSAQDPEQILAVKSLMTLVNNWRGPAGRMEHSALFPSHNVWYFNGFWAWDSWKHAVGILLFDPELAKDQVRAMFAHQDDRGMVPDVVYQNANEDNWRDTKPPLAGWAINEIYQKTGDLEFVREMYPRLQAYHRFWSRDRDHDQDGLCEYGSTDGTLVAARWESGMDNAVRFDYTTMLKNSDQAWSMDQESVDLNSYLYAEKVILAQLAATLGDEAAAQSWQEEASMLRFLIQSQMYDAATGWFYDISIDSGEFISNQGPEGWIPLWAGVANREQASRVRDTILDTQKFRTHVPFPTVSRSDPGFSDGYWRGLVWLDQAYFAIEGLARYGFSLEAEQLRQQLFTNLEGATVPGAPLRENYHPLTGQGRNVNHFSWTAAHLLLMTQ